MNCEVESDLCWLALFLPAVHWYTSSSEYNGATSNSQQLKDHDSNSACGVLPDSLKLKPITGTDHLSHAVTNGLSSAAFLAGLRASCCESD